MRLLSLSESGHFKLTSFVSDDVPPYAILSHTWGHENDELTYQDIFEGSGTSKKGYQKLKFCCRQSQEHDLKYFWVDTCCIDKSSSSELTESINSMFRWYQRARWCYVYLSDVSVKTPDGQLSHDEWMSSFRNSRWFTRGWTLQELLAPARVQFYSHDGVRLGDKESLRQIIHEVTGIELQALHNLTLSDFTFDTRLHWVESRQTSKAEDKAYCILGICDVYMPLIYGEGASNAFRRLRREIALSANEAQPPEHVRSHETPPTSSTETRPSVATGSLPQNSGHALPALLMAAASRSIVALERQLRIAPDVNVTEPGGPGRNALHFAVLSDHPQNIAILLRAGVNVHARANGGVTPLMLASMVGNADAVKTIIENGNVDPNARDMHGNTPLHAAAVNCCPNVVRVLLEHGADPFLTQSSGWTPLNVAENKQDRETIRALLQVMESSE